MFLGWPRRDGDVLTKQMVRESNSAPVTRLLGSSERPSAIAMETTSLAAEPQPLLWVSPLVQHSSLVVPTIPHVGFYSFLCYALKTCSTSHLIHQALLCSSVRGYFSLS